MSDDDVVDDAEQPPRPGATNPRIHARRVSVARERGRRRRRRILATLAVVTVLAAGLDVLHSSLLGARHVVVSGADNIPTSTVIAAAGLKSAPPLVDLDTAVIAERVERLPWVEMARVSISWPSTVDIAVIERTPVAVIAEPGARRSWAVVDASSRILEIVGYRPPSLPVIAADGTSPTTRSTGGYGPGSYLGGALRPLATVAAAMPQSMVAVTSDITIMSSLGIVVEMPGRPLAILGSAGSLRQKFVSLATVLYRASLTGVTAIDLRVPAAPVLLESRPSRIVAGHVGG